MLAKRKVSHCIIKLSFVEMQGPIIVNYVIYVMFISSVKGSELACASLYLRIEVLEGMEVFESILSRIQD